MTVPMDDRQLDRMAWGSWDAAEQSAHREFAKRTPTDRLAWLEDLLRLRAAVVSAGAEKQRPK